MCLSVKSATNGGSAGVVELLPGSGSSAASPHSVCDHSVPVRNTGNTHQHALTDEKKMLRGAASKRAAELSACWPAR